jgi:hypothetical protein
MIHQHTDEPIQGTPESPDLLKRQRFSCQIAEAMLSVPNSSGFVLSLEGPWGYGKTSILNLISRHYEQLPKEKRPIICTFNPWIVGNADTLVQSFLVQLAAAIGLADKAKHGQKAARELLSYSSVFTALKFIPGAEPWASIVHDVIEAVGNASAKISSLKTLDIEHQRLAVVKALGKLGRRIIVFIDDLDRLPPAEVFAMVRLVKAVGDFPGVVYLLCFEPGYIKGTLKAHGVEAPGEYLDKVIQTRLTLPQISKDDLLTILNTELDKLPEEAKKEHFQKLGERHNELYYAGLRNLFETPRDIKRLFNRVRFVEPGCRGEVNLADLIALEILALKAPSIFQHICECPSAYVGKDPGGISFREPKDVIKSFEGAREKTLSSVPDRLQNSVRELLMELFPLLNEQGVGVSADLSRTRGLVCSPDRLLVALSAGLPSGETSYAAAVEFLRNPSIRQKTLEEVSAAGTLSRFIEHLRFARKEIEVEDISDIARILGKILDTPNGAAAENAPGNFWSSGICRNTWRLIEEIIEKIPYDQRQAALIEIILDPNLLTLGAQAISELQRQHGGFSDEEAWSKERRWVDAATLEDLTAKWAQLVVDSLRKGRIFSATQSGMILFRLKRFQPDALSSVIHDVLAMPEGFDEILKAIGHRGTDSVGGKYAKFSDEDLEGFGGAKKMKELAAERLKRSDLPGELRYILTAITTGRKIYLTDGSETNDD